MGSGTRRVAGTGRRAGPGGPVRSMEMEDSEAPPGSGPAGLRYGKPRPGPGRALLFFFLLGIKASSDAAPRGAFARRSDRPALRLVPRTLSPLAPGNGPGNASRGPGCAGGADTLRRDPPRGPLPAADSRAAATVSARRPTVRADCRVRAPSSSLRFRSLL